MFQGPIRQEEDTFLVPTIKYAACQRLFHFHCVEWGGVNEENLRISIYSQNLSGTVTKIRNTNQTLAKSSYEIICLQETWLTSTIQDSEIIIY